MRFSASFSLWDCWAQLLWQRPHRQRHPYQQHQRRRRLNPPQHHHPLLLLQLLLLLLLLPLLLRKWSLHQAQPPFPQLKLQHLTHRLKAQPRLRHRAPAAELSLPPVWRRCLSLEPLCLEEQPSSFKLHHAFSPSALIWLDGWVYRLSLNLIRWMRLSSLSFVFFSMLGWTEWMATIFPGHSLLCSYFIFM